VSLTNGTGPGLLMDAQRPTAPNSRTELTPGMDPPADSLRGRLVESIPLFLASATLWAAAWAASTYRIRLLGSPFPLWIVLALNAAVIGCVGIAAMSLRTPEQTNEDDAEVDREPRAQDESSQRRADALVRTRPLDPTTATFASPSELVVVRSAAAPIPASSPSDPVGPSPGSVATAPAPRGAGALALRRATGLLEVREIADRAISAGEQHGSDALQQLLDSSARDLTQIAKLLGAPRLPGEATAPLMIRLLRVTLEKKLPTSESSPTPLPAPGTVSP
jgi:hypothetical protein